MALRTNETEVREIIALVSELNVHPFIQMANGLTTQLASNDSDGELTSTELRMIEANLSAHFASFRDPQYHSKSTGKANATFQGKTDMYLESSLWGQAAMTLDTTGWLATKNKENKEGGKRKLQVQWLGKPPSSQTDYKDRD